MIISGDRVDPAEFARHTGFEIKPEGACRGDLCVPLPDGVADGVGLDVEVLSQRLGMALVRDQAHGITALGPPTASGRALTTAELPEIELPDRDGNPFNLRALAGSKVLLVVWASW